MRLKDRTAAITGAGSGIGRAIANLFAEEGARILAADWNEQNLGEVVKEVAGKGGTIVGIKTDVAKQADCEAMVDRAVDAFGGIDILVNNAGVMDLNQPVGELDLDMWRRVMSINVDGPLYAMRRAAPIMLAAGHGVILNTASVAGLGGAAAGAAYTASKHALVGLTKNTAWMYGKRGIRCNAIAAGAVQTNISQSVDMAKMEPGGSARAQEYYALIPAVLEPIDIARLALFLVSDDARHINGAIVPADAGWLAA